MKLNGLTRVVADLETSRRFYEDVLGFEPDDAYEPTRWQSYKTDSGTYFAVGEAPGSTNQIHFSVPDIEAFWQQVKDRAEVVSPLERTPWGTYRFVLRDPDGNLLGFTQSE